MARPKSKMPAYRYHLSGQAITTIDGRNFYLGRHQSAASVAKYAALLRVYQQNELRLPEDFDINSLDELSIVALPGEQSRQDLQPIRVRDIVAAYRI